MSKVPEGRETRQCNRAVVRATTTAETISIAGYALVYDLQYSVLGGPPFGWTERIASGAADRAAREDDVRLLVNHAGVPLARTSSGTLRLESDAIGLRISADLDIENPSVRETVSALSRGDLNQMSIAFRALRQRWNDDYTDRTIEELELADVSLVTFPANEATVAQIVDRDKPRRFVAHRRRALTLIASAEALPGPKPERHPPRPAASLSGGQSCWSASAPFSALPSTSATPSSSSFVTCSTPPTPKVAPN